MRSVFVAAILALSACSGPVPAAPAPPAQHRIAELCDAARPPAVLPSTNERLHEWQQANFDLSQCMWRNAIAFSGEHESAEIVGKAVADACSDEATHTQIAQAIFADGHMTAADLREFQTSLDREGMTDVVRARAGHCDLP